MKNSIRFLISLFVVAACSTESPTPVSKPAPTRDTPYAVGSSTVFLHDESRPYDSVAGIDEGMRTLITEIWYPIDHEVAASGDYRRATYGDYVFGNRDVHELMMTKTTFFHFTVGTVKDGVSAEQIDDAIEALFYRERASYVDAPVAESDVSWPVIVMSHGDAGSRYNMESLTEHLAANGYIVIAPEHTGNSPYSMTGHDPAFENEADFREVMADVMPHLSALGTYGNEEQYGQSYAPSAGGRDTLGLLRQLDASLLQRLNDLRVALAELDRMNAEGFAGTAPGSLDLDRIGLMGRSFGGATTLLGLVMEPRFTAGFSVVPPGYIDPRPGLPAAALKPSVEESVLLSAGGLFPLTTISKPTVLLSGAEDALIIGLSASVAAMAGLPAPSADNPHPLLRQAFKSTDAPVVWGMLADSNHASLGVSGGYWRWDLKPNTQARTFDRETEFELVDPELAHRMQRELALDFFDLTIREVASALERLATNDYADQGLTIELRNF